MRRDEHREHDSAAIGCVIILFGGCACIGGLLYFLKVIIALFTGAKII